MIHHDRLFKELLSTFIVEFLELFFGVRGYVSKIERSKRRYFQG